MTELGRDSQHRGRISYNKVEKGSVRWRPGLCLSFQCAVRVTKSGKMKGMVGVN